MWPIASSIPVWPLVCLGALVGGYMAGHRAGATAEKAQNLESDRIAQVAMDSRMEQARQDAEKSRQLATNLRDKIEVQHAKATQTIIRQRLDNERLAHELGGLRDPGAGSAADRDAVPADAESAGCDCPDPASGRLSAAASRFLLDFAQDADAAAQYARDCHEWAVTIPNLKKEERSGSVAIEPKKE